LKIKIFIIVLLLFNAVLIGQSQVQDLIRQGSDQAYNMELNSAEKTFNKILELRPNSPVGYYHIAQIHFWIYLGSRDPGEYQVFLKFADMAQDRAEKVIDKNPKDYQTKYLAGNLASFRAMAQATNNSSVDAFWSSKKAVNYYEETLKLNPKFYNAYLGLGLFDYAMSFVPDFLKWAVNLTGLSSDKRRGFNYIKTAFKKGTEKTEAAFHLSKIYTDYLAEYDSAFILLQSLSSRYPNNTLFIYQYAVSLIKDKQLDRANDMLNRVINLNNKRLPQITALSYYRKGEIYFKKNQFKTAIKNYKKFLDISRELDFIGYSALNTALCYKLNGQEKEFQQYLQHAKGGNQDIFEDSYAKQKSEKYLSSGITPVELKIIKLKNDLDAGKYKIVYDSLKTVVEKIDSREDKAVAYVLLSEAALNLKKYSEAIYFADQIENLKVNSGKYTEVMALLLKAEAKYFSGKRQNIEDILDDAEDNNDFEFKDYIQSRIEWLKRRLGK